MKMKKTSGSKLLSVFTAFVVLLLSAAVFRPGSPIRADAKVVHSGTCGENASWTLDDAGTLTVSPVGSAGSIDNYSYFNHSPWYEYRAGVKEVVIKSGIKVIGSTAFEECTMTSVSIPDGIVSIGARAFDGCKSLK